MCTQMFILVCVCVCIHLYIYIHVCICFQICRLFLEACTRNRGGAKLAVFGNANWVEAEILDFFILFFPFPFTQV